MSLPIRVKYPGDKRELTFDFQALLVAGDDLIGFPTFSGPAVGAYQVVGNKVIVRIDDEAPGILFCTMNTRRGAVVTLGVDLRVATDSN